MWWLVLLALFVGFVLGVAAACPQDDDVDPMEWAYPNKVRAYGKVYEIKEED